jgi:PBP1b-binding outer membrane lipoprotein LpoB
MKRKGNKMKKIILVLFLVFISGCSKEEPIATISQSTQKEVTTLQKDIEKSTCENKSSFIERLDGIKAEIKNITIACNLKTDALKQENSKLKIIMASLLTVIVLSTLAIIKKR